MNILEEIKKYLTRGTIETSKLLILLPQCAGYDQKKHDETVLQFVRACKNYVCDFEIIGNKIVLCDQCGMGYTLEINYESGFDTDNLMEITLDISGPWGIE